MFPWLLCLPITWSSFLNWLVCEVFCAWICYSPAKWRDFPVLGHHGHAMQNVLPFRWMYRYSSGGCICPQMVDYTADQQCFQLLEYLKKKSKSLLEMRHWLFQARAQRFCYIWKLKETLSLEHQVSRCLLQSVEREGHFWEWLRSKVG